MLASELFVKCLETEGTRYIFGLPGEETLSLNEALRNSSIEFILTRHEQSAAFMADVYGRLTGKAGVCLSTLGPGATNLITGVADANQDRAPLVAITGQISLDRMHKEYHQFIDIPQIFSKITKWSVRIQKATIIPEIIRKSFKMAETEKPGACHIELPDDIANKEVGNLKPLPRTIISPSLPRLSQIKIACKMIEEAETPVILSGNGVIRARASAELQKFSRDFNIPVAQTFMGKGVIPYEDELSLSVIGLQSHDYVACGFDIADLVIAIGYDMVEYSPTLWNPNNDKKIIHIDSTPAEVDSSYLPSIEIIGDIKDAMKLFVANKISKKKKPFAKSLREQILTELKEKSTDDSFPLKPQRIIHDIWNSVESNDIIVSDVGAHKLWIARMFLAKNPNTVIISNGFASMGISIPGALSAKLIHPERNSLAICGDGGFLMNVHELETAKRLNLPIVAIIFNDGSYGMIKWHQEIKYGRSTAVDFGNPDFARLAESFGCAGYTIERASQLKPTLQEAFNQDLPAVVNIPVDYSENVKLSEKFGALVCPL
jgi:acetolactate synthase-1/2/3 large subunit